MFQILTLFFAALLSGLNFAGIFCGSSKSGGNHLFNRSLDDRTFGVGPEASDDDRSAASAIDVQRTSLACTRKVDVGG